ncbi:MAG TPA: oxygen-independent coproporphyrinogen III oxidase [Salinivirga sp.]|uniref:oxygen-independent coproporphyrinogen III oxidase n=1 Tax=Salinivirga sp. TaxID=1970192 RepID=UPI002B48DCBC|nr:oxygen-independent coproporphyrinogen III oxidase [Salinivirga sp.]HKK60842.1 oxygen-independent coproporphyrinogen III oxidase [Salinivirga sp.]
MQVPDSLLKKYNVPVPRYTSYPPANHFSDNFNGSNYKDLLVESNMLQPELISIYIHIPFCNKMCFYCGCNMCLTGDKKLIKPYIQALKKEITMVAAHLDKRRKVAQIHYGGGTPNSIASEFIREINEYLFNTFEFIDKPEIAIETHPAHLDEKYISELKDAGFNRFSMGIQDFNEEVLKAVNRDSAQMPVQELMQLMRSDNPEVAVNLDFIYGLPQQTPASFVETMEKAVQLQPDRLVTFSYAHVPWIKKQQKILEKRGLPSTETKMEMFLAAYHFLIHAGYHAIGLDHYVRENDELFVALKNKQLHRNFQGYATRRTTGQVYAFGMSAISQTESGYAQNEKDTQAYIDKIESGQYATVKGMHVSQEQTLVREIITHLMCNKEIDWQEMSEKLNITEETLKTIVQPDTTAFKMFDQDKLINPKANGFEVTELGSLFIRNIAAALDPAYKEQQQKYSKSV